MKDFVHLRFFIKREIKNPCFIMSREDYDLANSYEPMQYRPEHWESFDKRQRKHFDEFERLLSEKGYFIQVGKFAVMNEQDFQDRKMTVEYEPGFIRWIEDNEKLDISKL